VDVKIITGDCNFITVVRRQMNSFCVKLILNEELHNFVLNIIEMNEIIAKDNDIQ